MRTLMTLAVLGICLAGISCAHTDEPVAAAPTAAPPTTAPAPAAAPASPADHGEELLRQCQKMHELLRAGKVEAFVTYMDPNVVRMAGSTAAIVQGTRHVFTAMARYIKEIKAGPVSEVVEGDGTLAAYVDVLMTYQLPRGRVLQKTYYVASSRDRGKTWKFMSSQCKPAQQQATRKWYPKLAAKVKEPKCWAKKGGEGAPTSAAP